MLHDNNTEIVKWVDKIFDTDMYSFADIKFQLSHHSVNTDPVLANIRIKIVASQ